MKYHIKSIRPLMDEIVMIAILLLVLLAVLVVALVVRITRDTRKGRRFRDLIRDWLDEREKHESQ